MTSARMPTVGEHRGIPLFDFQPPERLERVRKEIDKTFEMRDFDDLVAYLKDWHNPPEARAFAYMRIKGAFEVRSNDHAHRGDIDLAQLKVYIAGWDSLLWNHTSHYVLMFETAFNAPGARKGVEERPPELAERMRLAQEEVRLAEREARGFA